MKKILYYKEIGKRDRANQSQPILVKVTCVSLRALLSESCPMGRGCSTVRPAAALQPSCPPLRGSTLGACWRQKEGGWSPMVPTRPSKPPRARHPSLLYQAAAGGGEPQPPLTGICSPRQPPSLFLWRKNLNVHRWIWSERAFSGWGIYSNLLSSWGFQWFGLCFLNKDICWD